jgi:chromate transporter
MEPAAGHPPTRVPLRVIGAQWLRLGVIGFGGPPTHIALLRRLCVEDHAWISEGEFQDALGTTNLLPGPASTQLAIWCASRIGGTLGGAIGGICFIVPGLIAILALSVLFLSHHSPGWVHGAAAGAGAGIGVVALRAAWSLLPASWRRAGSGRGSRARFVTYLAIGALGAWLFPTELVLALIGCGLVEIALHRARGQRALLGFFAPKTLALTGAVGGLGPLSWVAFKVGALSYGGGFVIVPLMQSDATTHYHWMTNAQFLDAVALGQITPGPVVQTIAAIGYAEGGIAAGLLAALIAFAPSFALVLLGRRAFERVRANPNAQAFLNGAGPAAIGAIGGTAVILASEITHLWQIGVLAVIALWVLVLAKSVPIGLLVAGVLGVVAWWAGLPVTH